MDTLQNNKTKRICFFCGWIIVMGSILIQHFNIYKLCLLAAAAVYLLFTEALGTKKNMEGLSRAPLACSLDTIIGMTGLTLLGYHVLTFWPEQFPKTGPEFKFALSYVMYNFGTALKVCNKMVVLLLITAFLIGKWKPSGEKYWVLNQLYRFLSVWSVFFLLYYIQTRNVRVGLLFTAMALIYFAGHVMEKQSRAGNPRTLKWLVRFGTFLLAYIALGAGSYTEIISGYGYLEYHILYQALSLKNVIFICLVLGILLSAEMLSHSDGNGIDNEFVYIQIISMVVICFALVQFYVGYWWIILAAYYILNIAIMHNRGRDGMMKNVLSVLWTLVVLLFIFESHIGYALPAFVFLVSLCLLYLNNKKIELDSLTWKSTAVFSTWITAIISLNAVIYLWGARHITQNFIIIVTLAICSVGFIWLCSYNPELFVMSHEKIYCGVIVFCMAVLCMLVCYKGGSAVKFTIDKNNPQAIKIAVKAKGEDNSIASAKGYWMDDYTEAIFAKGMHELPPKTDIGQISGEHTLNDYTNGKLTVVVTDKNGVVTTRSRWFHKRLIDNPDE